MNIPRKTVGSPQSQRQLKQGIFKLVAAVAAAGAIAAIASFPAISQNVEPAKPKNSLQVSQLQQNTPPIQTVQQDLSGGLLSFIILGGVLICLPIFFGELVVIGDREVGIISKKFTLNC